MVNSESDIGEAHSGNILTESHTLSALSGVLYSAAERAGNNLNRLDMEHI